MVKYTALKVEYEMRMWGGGEWVTQYKPENVSKYWPLSLSDIFVKLFLVIFLIALQIFLYEFINCISTSKFWFLRVHQERPPTSHSSLIWSLSGSLSTYHKIIRTPSPSHSHINISAKINCVQICEL